MPMMTITVQGKADPERGKKRGRIKSETGMLFQATPELLSKVIVGEDYELAYKEESFNNANYRVVEAIYPAKTDGSKTEPPRISTATYAAGSAARGNIPATDRDMHIFVCGAYNNALGNPSIDPFGITTSDKLKFITEQMELYRLTLGRKPQDKIETGRPSLKEEMNDDIPYDL